MKRYWMWVIIIGTVLHLMGAGAGFNHIIGGFLAIMLIVGGMQIIINGKTLGQAVGPAIAGAFIISIVPPFIAGIVRKVHGDRCTVEIRDIRRPDHIVCVTERRRDGEPERHDMKCRTCGHRKTRWSFYVGIGWVWIFATLWIATMLATYIIMR